MSKLSAQLKFRSTVGIHAVILFLFFVTCTASTQTSESNIANKAFLDKEGNVHIVLNNGKEIQPSKLKGQFENSEPVIAEDRKTVAWMAYFENCCTSYNIPMTLIVFRSGKIIRQFKPGLMIANWKFEESGRKIGIYTNTVHGDFGPTYDLYETMTGKHLKHIVGPVDENSPQWVKRLGND